MRICINGRFLIQPLTGVQRYAREIVRGFDELLEAGEFPGAELSLVVPNDPAVDLELEEFPLRHISIERLGARTAAEVPRRSWGQSYWEQRHLATFAEDRLLFCPANTAPIVRLATGRPTVVTLHSVSFREVPEAYGWKFRLWYRLMLRAIVGSASLPGATSVITVSESERTRILNYYPALGSRLHAIENGAVPDRWHRFSEPERPAIPRVLFVGTLHPAKNLATLVEAFRRVRSEFEVELHVVGATAPAYSADRTNSTEASGIVYHGQVENEQELVRHYRQAKVLVHPSRYESSGLPPTEAIALGCPVICSDLPVLRNRCGTSASYFHPDDVDQLTRLLRHPLTSENRPSPGSRRSWQHAAREAMTALIDATLP